MVVELAALGVAAGVVDAAPAHRALVSRLERHVRLGADDGRDAARAARLVEVEDAVEIAVVGDAEGRLAIDDRSRDQLIDPRGAVEHRELRVGVQMGERSLAGHAPSPLYDGRRGVSTGELQLWHSTLSSGADSHIDRADGHINRG